MSAILLYLPRDSMGFSHTPVPPTKAGTNEVCHSTTLQQGAHLYPSIVDAHKLGHLQQTYPDHCCLRTRPVPGDTHQYNMKHWHCTGTRTGGLFGIWISSGSISYCCFGWVSAPLSPQLSRKTCLGFGEFVMLGVVMCIRMTMNKCGYR